MTIEEILRAFPGLKVLVVGDICLDRWCIYDPALNEPSRETGIPRHAVVRYTSTAGACGTIANNLAELGVGQIELLGVIGEDAHGDELLRALADRKVGTTLIIRSSLVQTFTYIKHINSETGIEDVGRVDYINAAELPQSVETLLLETLLAHMRRFDAILVCDQAETSSGGVVTPVLRDALNRLAGESSTQTIWVDSRRRAELFRNCYLKPNEDEAREAAERLGSGVTLPGMRERLGLKALVVTEGERGSRLVDIDGERQLQTITVERPVDICGAGDSFSAGAASALAAGATIDQAVHMGNLVASVTIMKRGTGTATPAEVMSAAARAGLA